MKKPVQMRVDESLLDGFKDENLSNISRKLFCLYQKKVVVPDSSDHFSVILCGLGAELVVMESSEHPPDVSLVLDLESRLLRLPCASSFENTFDQFMCFILLGRVQVLRMKVAE